jgi:hypothetical protein
MTVHEVADVDAAVTWASRGPRQARPHALDG